MSQGESFMAETNQGYATKAGKKKKGEGVECLKWAEMNANGQFGFLKR